MPQKKGGWNPLTNYDEGRGPRSTSGLFSVQNITKKFKEVDIYVFKTKNKSINARCEICLNANFVVLVSFLLALNILYTFSSFPILTLNIWWFTFIYTEEVIQRYFSRKLFYEYLAIYRKTSIQERDYNFIEITLLHGYSLLGMLNICSRTPFLDIWGTASVYRSKYRDNKRRGSPKAGKKLFEIHFNIINTFSNFIRDFYLVAKRLVFRARSDCW